MSQILESNHEESFNNLQLNRETCEKIESSLESQNVGETLKSNSQCQKVNSKQVSTEKSQTEIKETKKRVRNKRINQNIRKGHWSEEQNKKYHWFLEIYSQHFIQKQMRRLDKIFKTMSRFIGTREAQQCRSHHQKMQKKYISFPNILTHLRISHYGTEQTNPILQDMNRNNIKQKSILLQMKELQEIEDRKAIPSTPKTVQGMNLVNEMQLQREIPIFRENNFNSFENILGNDYEKQLDFIDELLF